MRMMMTTKRKSSVATSRIDSNVDHFVCVALKGADAKTLDGVERCFDSLCRLRDLKLSCKDLYRSQVIFALSDLRDHGNPKIRMAANLLFTSWMKTLYVHGRQVTTTCDKTVPLSLKKPNLKEKKQDLISSDIEEETRQETEILRLEKNKDETREVKKKQSLSIYPKYYPSLKSLKDNTCAYVPNKSGLMIQKDKPDSKALEETKETKQNLNKYAGFIKSFDEAKPILSKKQYSALPMKLSTNPSKYVSITRTRPPIKHSLALKKNSREMLEIFEVAKKSAEVANVKGLLLAKKETSTCVETLSLLLGFSIISTATDTRKIMDRLSCLTRHKDRKICNAASTLFQHWSQSIRDQQHKDARKTQV
ncbi:unnamed protein product [Cochlearia groenlandica]